MEGSEILTVYGWHVNGIPVVREADSLGVLERLAEDGFLVRRLVMTRAAFEALPELADCERRVTAGALADCRLAAAVEGW